MKRNMHVWQYSIMTGIVCGIDFLSKQMIINNMYLYENKDICFDVLHFTFVKNSGAAFGIGQNFTQFFTLASLLAVIYLRLFIIPRMRSKIWIICLGLINGGAVGNLVDRIFREPFLGKGKVIDFINLPYLPVFNMADLSIVVGTIILIILILKEENLNYDKK